MQGRHGRHDGAYRPTLVPAGQEGLASPAVSPVRRCSRTACALPAVATLTYVYADSTAVVGPLATHAEPHCYDLCAGHAARLTAPRGWEVVRHAEDPALASGRAADDLTALADAVREAARPAHGPGPGVTRGRAAPPGRDVSGRRGTCGRCPARARAG